MKKCKYCQADMEEDSTICPNCGKADTGDTPAEEAVPAEEAIPAEEAVPAEEALPEEEATPAEASADAPEAAPAAEAVPGTGAAPEEAPAEIKEGVKATPGKIALAVAAVVVLLAALIALIMAGLNSGEKETEGSQPDPQEIASATITPTGAAETTEATIPQDGNPDDETCKGTYTASDAQVAAAADTVVAKMGDYELTNSQLQVYYWMEVQSFLSTYGSYAPYFGLDYTQPLDTQVCGIAEGVTWQQFFLNGALHSWQNYQALAAEAEEADFQVDDQTKEYLESIESTMEQSALALGFENAQEYLAYNVGQGAQMQDYVHFMELYYPGNMYFDVLCEENAPSGEEVEAYFAEHEQEYEESGLSRDDKYVDVRHVLIMPDGATSENIRTDTFPEEAWETSRVKAEELLAQWEKGDKSEDSFAALAVEHSADGSSANGGLISDVQKGQMTENFEAWCFDEARQPGDYGLVETEFGYHLMFYVDSRPIWRDYAENDLINERVNLLLNEIIDKHPMEVKYADILLGYVDLTGGTSSDS